MSKSDQEDIKSGQGITDTSAPDDGVDVSLIRWMLSLNHRERLQVLQQNVNSLLRLKNAKRGS